MHLMQRHFIGKLEKVKMTRVEVAANPVIRLNFGLEKGYRQCLERCSAMTV